MYKHKTQLLYLFTLLITGCLVATQPAISTLESNPQNSSSPSPQTPTSNFLPNTLSLTQSAPIPVSPTPQKSDTPSLITPATPHSSTPRLHYYKHQCLEVASEYPSVVNSSGPLALIGYDFDPDSYLLNLTTGAQIPLPRGQDEYLTSPAVSPNRQWLAYYTYNRNEPDTSRIIITDVRGESKVIAPVNTAGYSGIADWSDNEHLLLEKYQTDPDAPPPEYPYTRRPPDVPLPLVLWNPFTGEERILLPDFPDINDVNPYPHWAEYTFSETVYDQALRLVVYPRLGPYGVTLWDVQARQAIVSLEKNFGSTPRWSPDGQYFLTNQEMTIYFPSFYENDTPDQELFQVSRNGEIKRLTYLTKYFSEVTIEAFSWSPDGRQVAFWMSIKPDHYPNKPPELFGVSRLAVLDTMTGEVVNFCIPGGAYYIAPNGGTMTKAPGAPIWSPDGSHLLVEALNYPHGSYAVVVDLSHGYAFRVAENKIPGGWMVGAP